MSMERSSWRGWLRRWREHVDARVLAEIGGRTPHDTGKRVELLEDGEMRKRCRLALEVWGDRFRKDCAVVDVRSGRDWEPCGNGVRRKEHWSLVEDRR